MVTKRAKAGRGLERPARAERASSSSISAAGLSSVEFNPSWNHDFDERPPVLAIATSMGEVYLETRRREEEDDERSQTGRTLLKKAEEVRRKVDGINAISWSGDGTRIAVAHESGKLYVLDAARPLEVPLERRRLFTEDGACTCVSYTPQSNVLLAGSYEGTIYSFDTRMRRMIRRIAPAHDGEFFFWFAC